MDKPHKKLEAWKTAMEAVMTVYKITNKFPDQERYGLISQMRRAAISIPCNIAEGAGRKGKKEFRNFLNMAQGSLSELDTQLEVSKRLGYIGEDELQEVENQLLRIDKMLSGLIRSLIK